MVDKALKTISKAEKELENMVNTEGQQDPAEQTFKEMRHFAEQAAFTAVKATENWGKAAFDKAKEITEEVIL